MPELPDVVVYVERLRAMAGGQRLSGIRLQSPFVLRSVEPPITGAEGKRLTGVRRLGKRIVIGLEEDLFLVRQPCPACGAPVQRIVYAENECNYCPHCQTGGRILADRSLSRLLKDSWPRNLEELEGKGGRWIWKTVPLASFHMLFGRSNYSFVVTDFFLR